MTTKNLPQYWRPGQSGNPAGRPKDQHKIQMLARSFGAEAIDKLVELMRSGENQDIQRRAAMAILDRGYGKPQPATDEQPLAATLTTDERIAMLMELAKRYGYRFVPDGMVEN